MESYKKALETARRELVERAAQREWIDRRIGQLKKFIEGIGPLVEGEELEVYAATLSAAIDGEHDPGGVIVASEGITDVMKRAFVLNDSLTPTEVRDQLIVMGFDMERFSNVLATIHSVLKRLVEQQWLEQIEKDGKPAYRRRVSSRTNSYLDPVLTAQINQAASQIATAMEGLTKSTNLQGIQAANEAISKMANQVGKQVGQALSRVSEQQNKAVVDAFSGKGGVGSRRLGPRPEQQQSEESDDDLPTVKPGQEYPTLKPRYKK
jgi:predicted transcriptional regulator